MAWARTPYEVVMGYQPTHQTVSGPSTEFLQLALSRPKDLVFYVKFDSQDPYNTRTDHVSEVKCSRLNRDFKLSFDRHEEDGFYWAVESCVVIDGKGFHVKINYNSSREEGPVIFNS